MARRIWCANTYNVEQRLPCEYSVTVNANLVHHGPHVRAQPCHVALFLPSVFLCSVNVCDSVVEVCVFLCTSVCCGHKMAWHLFLYHSLPFLLWGRVSSWHYSAWLFFSSFWLGWQPASIAILLSPCTHFLTLTHKHSRLGLQACRRALPSWNLGEGTAWVGVLLSMSLAPTPPPS